MFHVCTSKSAKGAQRLSPLYFSEYLQDLGPCRYLTRPAVIQSNETKDFIENASLYLHCSYFISVSNMFEEHLSKLTVAQLKEELTNRTLETTGKKAELVSRLNTYLEGKCKDH